MFPMLPRGTSIPAGESAAQLLMRGTADVHVAGVARGPSRRVHRALTRRRRRPCQDPPRQIRGAQRRRRRPRRRCGQVPGLDSATLVLAVMGADRPPLGALHWRRPCHGPSRQLETQRRVLPSPRRPPCPRRPVGSRPPRRRAGAGAAPRRRAGAGAGAGAAPRRAGQGDEEQRVPRAPPEEMPWSRRPPGRGRSRWQGAAGAQRALRGASSSS